MTKKKGTDLWEKEWGYTDDEKQIIYINSEAPLVVQWNTLFHEVNHTIEFAFGFELHEDDDFSVPNLLGTGWMSVVLNNRWIQLTEA